MTLQFGNIVLCGYSCVNDNSSFLWSAHVPEKAENRIITD